MPTSVSHAEVDEHGRQVSYFARYARLHRKRTPDCWATTIGLHGNDKQHIEVVLPRLTRVTAIATQGCHSLACWTSSYTVQYSAASTKGPFVTLRTNDSPKVHSMCAAKINSLIRLVECALSYTSRPNHHMLTHIFVTGLAACLY